jgi:transposase InsO family protein
VLAYPVTGVTFILDTDASNVGIGAVLAQEVDGSERVIAYYSRSLSKAERNYCVTRRELLAMVDAIKHFHKYLYGQRFVLRTDHAALKWLLSFKSPEGQVARWIERLQTYDFETRHRKGQMHKNADCLSRRPCKQDCKHCTRVEEKELASDCYRLELDTLEQWGNQRLREEQLKDDTLAPILRWKEEGRRPDWQLIAEKGAAKKAYWAQWDSLTVNNGVMKRVWESADGASSRLQVVLPQSRVADVLRELHNGVTGAHLGVNKTLEKVRQRFYWFRYREDVEDWCKRCDVCMASKGPHRRSRGQMQQYNVGVPFERIAIDVAGPFPETKKGNKFILVAIDYFTKWPEAYAMPNQEAVTVADALVENWVCGYGVPKELHSDQGRNFESRVFQEKCRVLGIEKTRTTPLHPQSDGMVERFNRTLEQHLSKMVGNCQDDWDTYIPAFLMSYRAAVHGTTRYSPAEMLFGRKLRLPCDLLFGTPADAPTTATEYVANLRRRMEEVHSLARGRIKVTSDAMKTRYDRRANASGFQAGELVWLYNPRRRKGRSPKLQRDWEGPYRVVKRINDVVHRIQRSSRSKMKVIHIDRLYRYCGEAESIRDEQT